MPSSSSPSTPIYTLVSAMAGLSERLAAFHFPYPPFRSLYTSQTPSNNIISFLLILSKEHVTHPCNNISNLLLHHWINWQPHSCHHISSLLPIIQPLMCPNACLPAAGTVSLPKGPPFHQGPQPSDPTQKPHTPIPTAQRQHNPCAFSFFTCDKFSSHFSYPHKLPRAPAASTLGWFISCHQIKLCYLPLFGWTWCRTGSQFLAATLTFSEAPTNIKLLSIICSHIHLPLFGFASEPWGQGSMWTWRQC